MSKKDNKIIVKYRFPEGYSDEYKNVDIDVDDWSGSKANKRPGFCIETDESSCFRGKYNRKIIVGGPEIEEVIFENFDFTMKNQCTSNVYVIRNNVMVIFDHCKFSNFLPCAIDDDSYQGDSLLVFNHCQAESVQVSSSDFWMDGKNKIRDICEILGGNLFLNGEVQMKKLNVDSGVTVSVSDAKLKIPEIEINADTIQLANSVVDSTSLDFSYDALKIEHTDFSARRYQFNDDAWKFKKKTLISTDDPQNEEHLAKARFLQVAKNLCQMANTANEDDVKQYCAAIDQISEKRIKFYERQIATLRSEMKLEEKRTQDEKARAAKTLSKRNISSVLPSRPKS